MSFNKMKSGDNSLYIISNKKFLGKEIAKDIIEKVFSFSYKMTFGKGGVHRNHRSGGNHYRKNGEIFVNTFQGKLAEVLLYEFFKEKKIQISEPDFSISGLGVWDTYDFKIKENLISVKSTKYYGNLLLLECKDWNEYGKYIPNDTEYSFFVLVRIKPDFEKIIKENKLLYLDECDEMVLKDLIFNNCWEGEITGFISNEDFKNIIIKEKFIIRQGEKLNGKVEMDVDNYYVQSGDLKNIDLIINFLLMN